MPSVPAPLLAEPRYRWVVLAVVSAGGFSYGWLWWAMVPYEIALARLLNLSASQVGLLVASPLLLFAALSIPIGVLVDRVGAVKLGAAGLFLVAGFALLRGYSTTFSSMFLFMVGLGLGLALYFGSYPKIISNWFSSREKARAASGMLAGSSAGSALSFSTTLLFFGEDWRRAFLVTGLIGLAIAAAWALLAREAPAGASHAMPKPRLNPHPRGRLLAVMRARNVWVMSLALSLFLTSMLVWSIYAFPFLVTIRKVSDVISGHIQMITRAGFLFGVILGAIVSDRIGLRRPMFLIFGLAGAGVLALAVFVPYSWVTWVFTWLIGLFVGAMNPIIYTVVVETPEVGSENAGSASGVVLAIGDLCGFLVPILLGLILRQIDTASWGSYLFLWVVEIAITASLVLCGFLMQETGRGRARP